MQGHPQGDSPSNPRRAKNRRKPAHNSNVDGSVSDSVVPSSASPRSIQSSKPRNASAAVAGHAGNVARNNGQHARPTSGSCDGVNPATPDKASAYAGARFQASPAPSSLPTPKFFSAKPGYGSVRPPRDNPLSKELSDASSPEPSNATPFATSRPAQNSPGLEFLFSAQRAEKERARSGGAGLSPELATRTPPITEPRNISQNAGKNAFLRELDGYDSDVPGPQSLPNHHQYMSQHRPSAGSGAQQSQPNENDAVTKSLRDLLFNQVGTPPPQASNPSQNQRQPSQAPASEFEGIFGAPSPGPSTPAAAPPPPSNNQQDYYSWQYGNRNLSPLFKASRNDNSQQPRPPSQLRQDASPAAPSHQPFSHDPNNPTQVYPTPQARKAQSGSESSNAYGSLPRAEQSDSQTHGYTSSTPSHHTVGGDRGAANPHPHPPSAPSNSSRDIRGMENDIKRMLNLNVLSSN